MRMTESMGGLRRNLVRRGFRSTHVVTREDLHRHFAAEISDASSIGFGGSVTTRELGLPALAEKQGLRVFDHWREPLDKDKIRREQLRADVFVTAVNAVTSDGIIVNSDGIGNRVAASIFGPRKIIFVITPNKVVPDLDAAMKRIKNHATPLNARRLDLKTPCAEDMQCHNCLSSQKIDRVFVFYEYQPDGTRFVVFLLNEAMGY